MHRRKEAQNSGNGEFAVYNVRMKVNINRTNFKTMTESHYSLKWNNHPSHFLAAIDTLLKTETLVDVTLVCGGTSIKAHKMVLSACSPLFQQIFSENPGKHPIIVLQDFKAWEVQAVIDFMYKGEVSVVQEQLQSLIKAAENLQVTGLVDQDPYGVDKGSSSLNQSPPPSSSPIDYEKNYFQSGRFSVPGMSVRNPNERISPFSPASVSTNNFETIVKLPHMSGLSFPECLLPRQECQSPIPRRKQARPRRRSGELCGAQDLSVNNLPKETLPTEETAENLCIKKQKLDEPKIKEEAKSRSPDLVQSPENDFVGKEFRGSPISAQPALNMKQEIDSHSPLPFPPMPSVSALAMTAPHSKFFGLDSPLGLFPPGLDGCRNPLFDIADHRATSDAQMFAKKKMGRPKGQHSAPRGGPPRSWTNAELTEALQQVWNKKMTTSQASRIFGIPYNSLLMYVRGKYGKSLKLEQLRKDCIGGPNPSMDLLGMGAGGNNNNNTSCKTDREEIQPNTRPSSTEEQPHQQPPMFNPFTHNFYHDFATGFPIPVNMIHLLPQSEKAREHFAQQPPTEDDCKKSLEDAEDLFRPPTLSVDDRRELVQQNGQD